MKAEAKEKEKQFEFSHFPVPSKVNIWIGTPAEPLNLVSNPHLQFNVFIRKEMVFIFVSIFLIYPLGQSGWCWKHLSSKPTYIAICDCYLFKQRVWITSKSSKSSRLLIWWNGKKTSSWAGSNQNTTLTIHLIPPPYSLTIHYSRRYLKIFGNFMTLQLIMGINICKT